MCELFTGVQVTAYGAIKGEGQTGKLPTGVQFAFAPTPGAAAVGGPAVAISHHNASAAARVPATTPPPGLAPPSAPPAGAAQLSDPDPYLLLPRLPAPYYVTSLGLYQRRSGRSTITPPSGLAPPSQPMQGISHLFNRLPTAGACT